MPWSRRFVPSLLCLGLLSVSSGGRAESQAAERARDAQGGRPGATRPDELHGDERILQALNRLTFGPRPGDVEAVRAMGLEKWFDEQLHPASLDESELNARLAQFPAMQWKTAKLLYELPSNAVLRQTMQGKLPVPQDGILHTIYENQMQRIAERQKGQQDADPMMAGMKRPDAGDEGTPEMQAGSHAQETPQPEEILNLTPQQRVERLAAMPQTELDAFVKELRGAQRMQMEAGMTPEQKQQVGALENPQRVVVDELMAERLTRDICSNAQLEEVMTDFWLNHFNVYLRKDEAMPYDLVSYERDTIRPHALGKFNDLLEAVAHSPAMLLYLDNASSVGPDSVAAQRERAQWWLNPSKKGRVPAGINENYGRELMELHTVSVNGGYTQADVIAAARILTGWTVDHPERGGGFVFNGNRHEPGTETVMGHQFKDHGEAQGEELLHFLATRPATARFLSEELAERFVSDHPPQSLVDRMARTYLKTGGDISAVLTTMFHSPEFWSASTYRAKVKTPLEYVVSAVRASDADVENYQVLDGALGRMGMPLYGCVPPDGYSWESSAWVSAGGLVDRMNFALALAANRLPGIRVAWAADTGAESAEQEEAQLEALVVPGGVSATTRAAVLGEFAQQNVEGVAGSRPVAEEIRRSGPMAEKRQEQTLAGLLLGSPEFQRR